MIDIALHINYLLLRHNWLTVTGLGAFVCEYKAAYYDDQSNIWFPPCRRIRFISGKFPEDNILLKSLLRKEDVTVNEAREIIHEFADKTLSKLNTIGIYEFSTLGVFHKTESGNIVFKSGVAPEKMNSILGYYPVEIKQEPLTIQKTYTDSKDQETSLSKKFNLEKNFYIPINKRFIKSVACILVFLALSLSFVVPTHITPHSESTASIDQTLIEKFSEDSFKSESITIIRNDETSTIENDQTQQIIENDKEPVECKYHLIVGTFRNENDAMKYVSMHQEDDYNLTIVPTRTLYRVACASSDTFEVLQQELNSAKLRSNYKKAWIWSAQKKDIKK